MCSCVRRSIANLMKLKKKKKNKKTKQFHWQDIHKGRIDNKFIIYFFFQIYIVRTQFVMIPNSYWVRTLKAQTIDL